MKEKKFNAEAMLSKLLLEAVRDEIDAEFVKALKDPCYVIKSTQIIFESEEDRLKYTEHFNKVWDERNDFLKDEEDE
tara:strand:- start:4003 stop:4233 length:231 start_codon:yes stop_codon:yes gene_type:complete